jgi:predicted TIM-barrel fold metal-dependent hydrolase
MSSNLSSLSSKDLLAPISLKRFDGAYMVKQWIGYGVSLVAIAVGLTSVSFNSYGQENTSRTAPPATFDSKELQRFTALKPIDSHTHIYRFSPPYVALLAKLHMHTLDIMVVSDNADPERKNLDKESQDVFEVAHKSDHRVFACTTFDAYRFNDPDFVAKAIAEIKHGFDEGAVAVKLWKNVGMEIKDAKGNYILPDDPRFASIYRYIAAQHKTLITHIADPDTAWLAPGSDAPDSSYFVNHPEWYMYKIPGSPSKEQILAARDHVLEANPALKVVGAHLGSMEGDIPGLSGDLDRHPNFAVDLTARMPYLMKLSRAQAIAFFTKYQDRLIYGTDDTFYPGDDVQHLVRSAESTYAKDWFFLSSSIVFSSRGVQTQGLALPDQILRKIYHENAMHWFSGMR